MKLFMNAGIRTNDKETVVLAILNGMYSTKYDYLITSISLIGYEITGKFLKTSNKRERTVLDGIKEAIQSLSDKGIIEVKDKNKNDYVLSSKGLTVDTKKYYFVVLEQWEMQRIFENAKKPFNLCSFFCCLLGTINNKTKEWHMSQDEMCVNWGYGKESVNTYIKQLEDMKLIYVYRHNKRRTDGTYHKLNNSYGRYADKDSIIKAAKDYESTVECEEILSKIDRRSIKQRYNAYCNGAKKYENNPTLVMDLYKECVLYNKSLKENPIEGEYNGEWKRGEPLDLSVFPDDIIRSANNDKNSSCYQWGEPDPMEKDFSIEEILDMPAISVSSQCENEDEDELFEIEEIL